MSDPIENPNESSTRSDEPGDLQGLPDVEEGDSESVRELAEEGQAFEAEVIDAVENSPDPDVAEVRTREVPLRFSSSAASRINESSRGNVSKVVPIS